ncbi:MAG TPA: VOC family protein [Terriglobia bacterium]|nr:VOC family protein [Terriglobia bacterium]
MAKAAKKKAKPSKKSAKVVAKSRTAKSAKPAKKKAAAKPARPAAQKTSSKVDPLNRKQYTSVTPLLIVRDIRKAVSFYVDALGFTVRGIMDSPQGPMHAELRFRDTTLMLSPESREQRSFSANTIGNTPVTLYLLVDDVDDVFQKAVDAGGKVAMPLMDQFWGDRTGMIADPEGNKWMIATHKADPTEAQMMEAMRKMASQAAAGGDAAAAASGSEPE